MQRSRLFISWSLGFYGEAFDNLSSATSAQCRNHPHDSPQLSRACVSRQPLHGNPVRNGKVKWGAAVAYIRPLAAPLFGVLNTR